MRLNAAPAASGIFSTVPPNYSQPGNTLPRPKIALKYNVAVVFSISATVGDVTYPSERTSEH